jgi:hypothetical protein
MSELLATEWTCLGGRLTELGIQSNDLSVSETATGGTY